MSQKNVSSLKSTLNDYEGMIKKKGGKLKPYLKRFFTLNDKLLAYYHPKNPQKPRGVIFLCHDTKLTYNGKKNYICIMGSKKISAKYRSKYELVVDSKLEYIKWITKIEKSIKKAKIEHEELIQAKQGKYFMRTIKQNDPKAIPYFLEKLYMFFLTDDKCRCEGMFRVTGRSSECEEVIYLLDHDEKIDFKKYQRKALGDVLKRYFRMMRTPLFPVQYYCVFIEWIDNFSLIKDNVEKIKQKEELIKLLTVSFQEHNTNYQMLKKLMWFLSRFTEFVDYTKMTAENLGIVFGPNLLRPDTISTNYSKDIMKVVKIITFFIKEYKFFFERKKLFKVDDVFREKVRCSMHAAKVEKLKPYLDSEFDDGDQDFDEEKYFEEYQKIVGDLEKEEMEKQEEEEEDNNIEEKVEENPESHSSSIKRMSQAEIENEGEYVTSSEEEEEEEKKETLQSRQIRILKGNNFGKRIITMSLDQSTFLDNLRDEISEKEK